MDEITQKDLIKNGDFITITGRSDNDRSYVDKTFLVLCADSPYVVAQCISCPVYLLSGPSVLDIRPLTLACPTADFVELVDCRPEMKRKRRKLLFRRFFCRHNP